MNTTATALTNHSSHSFGANPDLECQECGSHRYSGRHTFNGTRCPDCGEGLLRPVR